MSKSQKVTVNISLATIFWVCMAVFLFQFISHILNIFILLFTALLIALAVCPLVDWLDKKHVSRAVSTISILFLVFGILIYSTATLATPLFEQTSLFVERFPSIVDQISPYKIDLNGLTSQFSFVPAQVLRIALGTVSGLFTAFTVSVLSYYIIQEMHKLRQYFVFWFGHEKGERYYFISQKLEQQIGNWVRGELLLMIIVGVLSYLGYLIIGLPYTIALGVIAGMLELIPNIGPTIAAVPAILVGLTISPSHAIAALVVSIVVQQLENNLIVPKVMQKAAGLSPIVTIPALMIGFTLGGPLLAILSLPAVLTARVILTHVRLNKETSIPEIH